MKIIDSEDLKWNFNKSENVFIGWDEKFEFKNFDLVHAKINPKEQLKMHYHDRKGGDEVFCFFKGGHFKIKIAEKEEEVSTSKPFYVYFSDKEKHSIENLSEEELEFQAIYSPPFKPGEVKH